jgi:hypothetical protein
MAHGTLGPNHQETKEARKANTIGIGCLRCVRATTHPVANCVSRTAVKFAIQFIVEESGKSGPWVSHRYMNKYSIAKLPLVGRGPYGCGHRAKC